MKKGLLATALAATMLLTACGSDGRLSVAESCKLLNSDQFKPTGNQAQQAKQVADHYADMATKVDPSVGTLIQGMADLQKKVADSSTAVATPQQQKQFTDALNSIGKVCGN
ncbi:hypothetical protein GCM10027449_07640 [Sinomonas notoginsengisoli]|uniref:hypothetical protein n=1 Tax=Sinomonas notoginsengisoli TaxID=1457311 RepID=UPI001F2B68D9|nr:hypothetical protein [Sinomonas notoginsengisoli]